MKVIGLVIRRGTMLAHPLATKVANWATRKKFALLFGEETGRTANYKNFLNGTDSLRLVVPLPELATRADIIVVLGGDGSLISCARHSGKKAPLFIGVNFGTLGFLTEVAPESLMEVLEQAVKKKLQFTSRALFKVRIERGKDTILDTQCLNDVVIQKDAGSRLIELDVHTRGEPIMRVRADGLIVATPTGSTAYSMAAGGAIVDPSLPAMLVTAICPHSLTSRPLVLGADSPVEVVLPNTLGTVFAIVDGHQSTQLQPEDKVIVTFAPYAARFVRPKGVSYFDTLRRKLNWNIPNQSS